MQTRQPHWDWATQWSLPKIETFGIIVPGLFGYRMDTPDGGTYWGAVGRNPGWDRYFASGEQGSPPQRLLRFYGTGNYAGILVHFGGVVGHRPILATQEFRIFHHPPAISLVLDRGVAWFQCCWRLAGSPRFTPCFINLPYFSTIRNPVKFLFVFSWALVTVFAYGIHGLSRRYLEIPATGSASPLGPVQDVVGKSPRLRPKLDFNLLRGFNRQFAGMVDLCIAKTESCRLFADGGIPR